MYYHYLYLASFLDYFFKNLSKKHLFAMHCVCVFLAQFLQISKVVFLISIYFIYDTYNNPTD